MARLIDADKLIKDLVSLLGEYLEDAYVQGRIIGCVSTQPTACDTEHLMEENDNLKFRCRVLTSGTMCSFCPLECKHRTDEYRWDSEV